MNKIQDYSKLSTLFGLFTNPIRLQIFDVLIKNCEDNGKEETCVLELNKEIDLPQPYLSKHLKILRDSGVLNYRKSGNKVYYSFCKSGTLKHVFNYMKRCCDCCKNTNKEVTT